MNKSNENLPIFQMAKRYYDAGFSILPCKQNKRPAISSWAKFQKTRMTSSQMEENFASAVGIGLIAGEVSGGLFFVDFDNKLKNAEANLEKVTGSLSFKQIIGEQKPVIISTQSGGFHLYFKITDDDEIPGSEKLAFEYDADGNRETSIETRGERSYVLAPPTPGYKIISGSLDNIPELSLVQLQAILDICKQLDAVAPSNSKPVVVTKTAKNSTSENNTLKRVINESFNWRAYQLLLEAGWTQTPGNDKTKLTRPGKTPGGGCSATFGYKGIPVLHIFSDSSGTFESGKNYTTFEIIAILMFNGDTKKTLAYFKDNVEVVAKEILSAAQKEQATLAFKIKRILKFVDSSERFRKSSYNEITHQLEFGDSFDLTDLFVELLSQGLRISRLDLEDLIIRKRAKHFHPFKDYFDSIETKFSYESVTGSIAKMSSCVVTENQQLFDSMLLKHLVRAVEQARGGRVNRFLFVLQSEKQYLGKSEFINYLNPFKNEYFATQVGKEQPLLTLAQTFMVNFEELESLTKQGIDSMKALISTNSASYRRLFTSEMQVWRRHASLFGSTNKTGFLSDSENSRWLPFEITDIDYDYNNWDTGEKIDIDNVWAEAVHLWRKGFYAQPTAEEFQQLNKLHEKHAYSSDADLYVEDYTKPSDNESEWSTSTQVAAHVKMLSGLIIRPQQIGNAFARLKMKPVFKRRQKVYKVRLCAPLDYTINDDESIF